MIVAQAASNAISNSNHSHFRWEEAGEIVSRSGGGATPRGIEDIRSVIETWLVDHLHLSTAEADALIEWRKPSKQLPQIRLASRKKAAAITV